MIFDKNEENSGLYSLKGVSNSSKVVILLVNISSK